MNRFPTSRQNQRRPAFRRSWPACLAALLALLLLAAWPQRTDAGSLAREAASQALPLATPEPQTLPAPSPNWVYDDRDQVGSQLGAAVAAAGDVNGDGYPDFLLGADRYNVTVDTEGAAFVFLGGKYGLAAEPAWTAGGGVRGFRFGAAVAGAGDINSDGYDDLLVGAPRANPFFPEEGAAYLFTGSASGPGAEPAWSALGGQKSALLGSAVAGAGDVNGDGFDDILVGAPTMEISPTQTSEGAAFLYLGSETGLGLNPAWVQSGGQVGALFGAALAGAGDVNGDGFADVLIGAPNPAQSGQVHLYYGSTAGLAAAPAWTASDGQTGSHFGAAVTGAGDLNHDGYADIAVGAPYAFLDDQEVGLVYVYFGSPDGPSSEPGWVLSVAQPNAQFGASLAAAGDANHDGLDDLLVGAPNYSGSKPTEGAIFLYPGTTGVHSGANAAPQPVWQTYGGKAEAYLGRAVSGSSDFNLDGRLDVAAGAPGFNLDTFIVGRSMAYYGRDASLPPHMDIFLPIAYQTP